jgi:replication factor C subunit 3/5
MKSYTYNTLPWIEKYRPETLDEVISHKNILDTLKVFIKNKCFPHLLFYGPPGTGKTSVIMACAKQLYGKYSQLMVMELNASDDRGIEVVRNKIKQFVTTKHVLFKNKDNTYKGDNTFKLVILDETDAMTADAQAILRKVVEKYTSSTRFCLICNYIQNINPALQSRCVKFRFSPLANTEIKDKISEIVSKENINVTDSGINAILKISRGDMRKILNNLQSTNMAYSKVTEKSVNNCLGYPRKGQINKIFHLLLNESFADGYAGILEIKNTFGLSLNDIILEIHDNVLNHVLSDDDSKYEYLQNLSMPQILNILEKLRTIEFNQSVNTNENIQLGTLVGIFKDSSEN